MKELTSPIRFAVIGCGHIGRRHSEKITADSRAELVAQCDVKARGQVLAEEAYASVPYFRSVDELITSGIEFDIACVCVPNGLHAEIAEVVLRSRHHVLIEKPIVLNLEDGERLRLLAKQNDCRIYGVLQNRYTPVFRWLKETVTSGVLGQIYNVQMQCLWNRDERYYTPDSWHGDAELDGGTLYTQYSHFLDLLTWTMGRIEVESAHFANHSHEGLIAFEDTGTVLFRTEGGARGTLFYSTAVYDRNLEVSMTILAEHGTIKISGPYLNRLEHCAIRGIETPQLEKSAAGNQYGGYSGSAQNHHHVIANVVADLLGEPAEITTLDDGLAVVHLIQNIYEHK
ncbi:Gfo/Idh/MocA family protein [Porphyromonas sp. COT-290 OH3588]|uniref:Gfo/Idh/MocA family protein n=1 Tax=Porphyromonas sp. COT-290 OH3588 TaxID=1515617 RepID=UPI00052C6AE7|nr:oxidoreductase [Porphyromonas sp. COT-290 OH3588]